MKLFFHLYPYLGPALLTPLAAYLWWLHYGQAPLVALVLGVPVLHAYIVPGIGTNVLKMWAFNSRLRLGRFRPQHGFVFGSATAMIALPLIGQAGDGDVLGASLRVGCVLLAVNWLYDALAIRYGLLEVYNQPWAQGLGAWAVAADYVVWFFGVFGLIYGAGMKLAEAALMPAATVPRAFSWGAAMVLATISVPTLLYVGASWIRHGHSGCRPVNPTHGESMQP